MAVTQGKDLLMFSESTTSKKMHMDSQARIYKKLITPIFLIAVISIIFIFLELKHPYYFLQDDNRDFYLPYFIHTYESLINGEFVQYSFHQFLGYPVYASGQSGATYPFTYISVFLSKVILGHYYAAMDIYVFLHMVIGGLGFMYFMKNIGLDDKSALIGGFTWPLSSFIFYVSSSWAVISSVSALFPWVICYSFRFFKSYRLKDFNLLLIFKLLLFYIGFYQYFLYIMLFDFFTLVLLSLSKALICKDELGKATKYYCLNTVMTALFSLPLLLPVWHNTTDSAERASNLRWDEFAGDYYDISQWLQGIINPFSETALNVKFPYRHLNNLSHIGYVSIVLILVSLAAAIIVKRKNKPYVPAGYVFPFFLLGLTAFMWSCSSLFLSVIYKIPVLNRFRWPFKLELITNFYLICLTVIGLYTILNYAARNRKIKSILFSSVIAVQLLNFSCLYFFTPPITFETHLDRVPLDEPLKAIIRDGRVISVGFTDLYDSFPFIKYSTAATLGYDYATLLGLYHFAGYDPLLNIENSRATMYVNFSGLYWDKNIPFEYLRTWGVKWYVAPDDYNSDKFDSSFRVAYKDSKRTVLMDTKAKPFFYFDKDISSTVSSYKINANSIDININCTDNNRLYVNFLHNPNFKAYMDKKSVGISDNKIGQMVINVPAGKHTISIRYSDPYFVYGCYISLSFLVLSTVAYIINPLPLLFAKRKG